ncbi:MAG: cytochrome c biogenesis protein ResB [Desulfobacterales bacterium]|nr:cytochrome c biogenesis protein ResB [Desulfobacterales bacterium]
MSYINDLKKFFASIKLSVFLLLTIAVTSIIGTIIPQNESIEFYTHKYGNFWLKIFKALNVIDMYHSWWFRLLMLLLTLNIIVCSVNRLSSMIKIIFIKNPKFSPPMFEKAEAKTEIIVKHSMDDLKKLYMQDLSKKFTFCKIEENNNKFYLFAEKGRWALMGVYIVHLSILCLIIGALIGSIWGIEGYMLIPEGEASDKMIMRTNNEEYLNLGFTIKCESFNVSYYDNGTPSEYRSKLTITDGEKSFTKDIIVNSPLSYKKFRIFQSSYGTIDVKNVVLNIQSSESGMSYDLQCSFNEKTKLPENLGEITLADYKKNYLYKGHNIGESIILVSNKLDGEQETIAIPIRFANFDVMRKGKVVINVKDINFHYYTGLQITKDPGVFFVYLGFILIIAGCYITFFIYHQRLFIEVESKDGNIKAVAKGYANKNNLGMQKIVYKIGKALEQL